MPINQACAFRQRDLHQATTAWAACALAGIGQVGGAVAGAQQPLAAVVKNPVGLPVERHRHVRAAVQVGMRQTLVTNRKSTAGLAGIAEVKRYGLPALGQIMAVAKWQQLVHGHTLRPSRAPAAKRAYRTPNGQYAAD